MPFWKLTPSQRQTLGTAIAGKRVWDFGAGDGTLAIECIRLGAHHVTAVETHVKNPPKHKKLSWIHGSFSELDTEHRDTILFSWPWDMAPCHQAQKTLEHLRNAQQVIVIAQNTGGTRCGTLGLWEFLATKEILIVDPHPDNDLVIYDMGSTLIRKPIPLETAGMDNIHIHPYTPFSKP